MICRNYSTNSLTGIRGINYMFESKKKMVEIIKKADKNTKNAKIQK